MNADNLYLLNGKNQFLLVSLNPSEEDIRKMLDTIKNKIGIVREGKVYSLLNNKEIGTINTNKNIIDKANNVIGWADEEFAYSNRLLKIECSYGYKNETLIGQLSNEAIVIDSDRYKYLDNDELKSLPVIYKYVYNENDNIIGYLDTSNKKRIVYNEQIIEQVDKNNYEYPKIIKQNNNLYVKDMNKYYESIDSYCYDVVKKSLIGYLCEDNRVYSYDIIENQIFILSSPFIKIDDFKVQMLELYGIDILNDTIVQGYIPSI